jgi:N-methylhydantoinase A
MPVSDQRLATVQGPYRLGVDIGGTFTDLVLMSDGIFATKKVSSTTGHYGDAILTGLRELLDEVGLDAGGAVEVAHGTTVATNAVLERKGPVAGLITTRGFRDVLELRRMRFPELYNIFWEKPVPLASRRMRREVAERVAATGEVLEPLDLGQAGRVVDELLAQGVTSLAVCLLNSYANPVHERQLGELIQTRYPELPLSLSYQVLPEIKEYERTSTTVLNAYVMPVLRSYLASLQAQLEAMGVDSPLLIMQSSGGLMTARAAMERPVHALESGPAAGVVGAEALVRQLGHPNVITFDMGGTTAKASVIEAGDCYRTAEYEVGAPISISSRLFQGGGYVVRIPAIDIAEVGAGGGSIVWLDRGGSLQVGPRSAGAVPGPVCYGTGGDEPTITDVNLLLGYLNPTSLLAGALPIDREQARVVFEERVARPLGLPLLEAAYTAHQIANATMMRAIRAVSTERGRDARDFILLAFGGGGPLHAAQLAQTIGIEKVIIPSSPGLFSAVGLLFASIEHNYIRTLHGSTEELDPIELESQFASLEREAQMTLIQEGCAPAQIQLTRLADLRYRGQAHSLTITVPAGRVQRETLRQLANAFEQEHARTYGHRGQDEDIEVANLRLVARRDASPPDFPSLRSRSGMRTQAGSRQAYFGPGVGLLETPVLPGRQELAGRELVGPAIVEEYDTTIVVPPACRATLDDLGNVEIAIGEWSADVDTGD